MSSLKILYLSYDGLTDPLGASQILPYLLKLSEYHNITVVSFEKKKNYRKNKNKILLITEGKIEWKPLQYTKNPPLISTLWDILRLRIFTSALFKKERFDIVHCRSYITSMVGLNLKKRFNTKLIFDMRGLWVDERVEGGLWNLKNPLFYFLFKYLKVKEREFINNSDHIISLTHKARGIITSLSDKKNIDDKITVIPCCVDLDFFNKEKVDHSIFDTYPILKRLSGDEYVLLYLGSIGTWYMLDEMLDFFKELKKSYCKSVFLFITNDSGSRIEALAAEKNLPPNDIVVVEGADRATIPSLISLANSSVIFIRESFSKQASSPTKLGEILAMEVPCIVNQNIGDIDKGFMEKIGYYLEELNEKSYAECIKSIPNFRSMDKPFMRERAQQYFSLEKGVELYLEAYYRVYNN